jgi:hypothetical protein
MKILLLSFFIIYSFNYQNKEISGKVLDKNTAEELVGVMVIINKTDTTYTDLDGNFKFKTDTIKSINLNYISYTEEDMVKKIY